MSDEYDPYEDYDGVTEPVSDTPRTDAAIKRKYEARKRGDGTICSEELEYVEPEFARELERELTRALSVVEAARQHVNTYKGSLAQSLCNAVEEWEAGP